MHQSRIVMHKGLGVRNSLALNIQPLELGIAEIQTDDLCRQNQVKSVYLGHFAPQPKLHLRSRSSTLSGDAMFVVIQADRIVPRLLVPQPDFQRKLL